MAQAQVLAPAFLFPIPFTRGIATAYLKQDFTMGMIYVVVNADGSYGPCVMGQLGRNSATLFYQIAQPLEDRLGI